MKKGNQFIGKFLYIVLFLLVIPLGLRFWALKTEHLISLKAIESGWAGWTMISVGGILIIWGMIVLMVLGKGLPMNISPPKHFVSSGPFRISRHPIYLGFGILLTGYFMLEGSSSGLWLVTPITVVGMLAIVWGYERIDLKERFPDSKIDTFFDLPHRSNEKTNISDHLVSLFWVFSLLLLSNYLCTIVANGISPLLEYDIISGFEFETNFLALLSAVFVVAAQFIFTTKETMRNWVIASIFGISISLFVIVFWSKLGAHYLLKGDGNIASIATMPLFLILISLQSIFRKTGILAIILKLYGVVCIIIHLLVDPFAVNNLVASIGIFLTAISYRQIWEIFRGASEIIANSWKEWVFGKIRVINHGFPVGIGSFLGIFLAGFLAGSEYAWAILIFAFVVIIFSAIWAQLIEGSEKLKRPFGYYGALVGITFASLAVWIMGVDVWIVIGVISVVMPLVQAIGRIRCLINGCCHGSIVEDPKIGIRYHHHRSRVCGISGLKGKWLHPTPLYSILWLLLVGIILLKLWSASLPSSFIFGLYLILTGLGRFVEEAYRGEVQTPVLKGLRLYQWTAIASVIIGILMTLINIEQPVINPSLNWETVLAAIGGGLFTTFAMGVDFPYSNARFSRLV